MKKRKGDEGQEKRENVGKEESEGQIGRLMKYCKGMGRPKR